MPFATTRHHCPQCRRVQRFEQPPCPDAHGETCPDWVCTSCGTGIVAGLLAVPAVRPPRPAHRHRKSEAA